MKSQVTPLVKVAMPSRDVLMPDLEKILYGGVLGEGEFVYRFEDAFGSHFRLSNCIATSSGTAALHIALILAGVKSGDEVVSTSMTAEPTNTTILQVGAIPRFADVEPETGNLSPESVISKITSKTKAICVVHYAGYPARLDELRVIADTHGLKLIEDCAHALGSKYNTRSVGNVGDYAIFSFQAIKHMTTIDGGMLIVKNSKEIAPARQMRWFGMTKGVPRADVNITSLGFKYNMNNVSAVIGLSQLSHIDRLINTHAANGRFFDAEFENISGLIPAKVLKNADPSYWVYTLLTDETANVVNSLHAIGVEASKLHRPNHLHSIFSAGNSDLSGLMRFYDRLIHIPCGWWVGEDIRSEIVRVLRKG